MVEHRKRRLVKGAARIALWIAIVLAVPGYFLSEPILYGIVARTPLATNMYAMLALDVYDFPSRVARENQDRYRRYCVECDNAVLRWFIERRGSQDENNSN